MNKSPQNRNNTLHPTLFSAFSLVEAMIILVLISVAIMMLIPLMGPQKLSIPKWSRVSVTPPGGGVAMDVLTYGSGSNDRVGISSANPYDVANIGKLAVPNLSVHNTTGKDIKNIVWGDNFVSNQYCGNTTDNCNGVADSKLFIPTSASPYSSIQIGMNSCNEAFSGATCIRSNWARNKSCSNGININNRFVQNSPSPSSTIYMGTNDVSPDAPILNFFVYLGYHVDSEQDLFTINFWDETTPALRYIGDRILYVLPNGGNVRVGGMLYFDSAATTANGIVCDKDEDGHCKRKDININYRDEADTDNALITFGDNWPWAAPSDIRLKNILSEYTKGIKEILKVDTYTYSYKNDKENKTYAGIIAQRIRGIFDEALHKDENGYYSYERTPLLYAMTNSVKEINTKQTKIEKQQKETSKEADKLIKMYK